MLRTTLALPVLLVLAILCPQTAWAQFENVQPDEAESATVLGTAKTTKYQVGVKIQAVGGPCAGLTATIPVPADWPEQTVRLSDEEISPEIGRVGYRLVEGTVKEMMISVPRLNPGQTAVAVITVEVERRSASPPEDTSGLIVPRRLPLAMRRYLGSSPYIESRHGEIRRKASEITKDIESDWDKVEAIYDWVRDNISYTSMKPTNAVTALREEKGDFEDVTGLFIALCRASDIPARTVWIPSSSYAEFYLEDAEGVGHWYPCRVAGDRAFGEMPDHPIILQKGDNFRIPGRKDPVRFVNEKLSGKSVRGGGKPQVEFVREVLGG
ncbi:transglutaminase-like domain-containing protein [Bremerella sp. T1]|uniref:transglutaminase-like domain-containing protein n=1 Tax=Bremerella sp. TYQ1 TaxID=3119568 RepID=UPI001CC907B0|nr:transglutaminase domain-containing protein [Bremerella volcania]UBM36256.1 transglutaminase domain-containing protein [Bremerella volcania]